MNCPECGERECVNPYHWTLEEVVAAWRAFCDAPETATRAELRRVMDAARKDVRQ